MTVAGIGCRAGAGAAEILAAIDAALSAHALSRSDLSALATVPAKAGEAGIDEAASRLGVNLKVPGDTELAMVRDQLHTRSEASLAATGVESASEAAALAAAGGGARLLGPRIAVGPVSCALAVSEATP